jgi:RNA polymerase sigma-70 factor, ECF subfamily
VARRVIDGRNRSTRRLRNLLARLQASHRAYEQPPPWDGDPVHTRLLEAVESLRPTEREALKLVLWEQLSYAEAAEVLGVSVNAVGIRVHRAKASLRTALAPGGPPRNTRQPAPPAPARIAGPSSTMPKGN